MRSWGLSAVVLLAAACRSMGPPPPGQAVGAEEDSGIEVVTGTTTMGENGTFKCEASDGDGGVVISVFAKPKYRAESPVTVTMQVGGLQTTRDYNQALEVGGTTFSLVPFPPPNEASVLVRTTLSAQCRNPNVKVFGSARCLLRR